MIEYFLHRVVQLLGTKVVPQFTDWHYQWMQVKTEK